ncbi:MAG: hypothetical protein IKY41_09390 [Clostridia bacterium]|nr:hypothetical protein [Clostridia bacterium]
MSGKRDFDNSEFKIIAKRYVSIYGETLEKEALSEEVQALKQPEMPDLGRAKKKNSVKVAKYALIAAAVLVVCVLSFVVMATIGSIIKRGYVTSDKSSLVEEETVKWEAPNISLVGSRFTVKETKEDSGKVIYYISDDLGDDVVLTLSSGAENYRDGMHADVYNDKLVYVKSDYGYQLMAYEFDDTLVEISCKYNFDTLKAIDDSLRFDL